MASPWDVLDRATGAQTSPLDALLGPPKQDPLAALLAPPAPQLPGAEYRNPQPTDMFPGQSTETARLAAEQAKTPLEHVKDVGEATAAGVLGASPDTLSHIRDWGPTEWISVLAGLPGVKLKEGLAAPGNPRQATGAQWLGQLRNKGIGTDDLSFIAPYLTANKDAMLTPAQVRQAYEAAAPQITKNWKGVDPAQRASADLQHAAWDRLTAASAALNRARAGMGGDVGEALREFRAATTANEEAQKAGGAAVPNYAPTKHDSWVEPGGTNYREMVATLPVPEAKMPDEWQIYKKTRPGQTSPEYNLFDQNDELIAGGFGSEAQARAWGARRAGTTGDVFRADQHWDEDNPLYHFRVNDRTLPGAGWQVYNRSSGNKSPVFGTQSEAEAYMAGMPPRLQPDLVVKQGIPAKTLFAEEIQSDWHQQGRDRGYIGQETPEQKALAAERDRLAESTVDLRPDDPRYVAAMDRVTEINRIIGQPFGDTRVPDAPYKKNWHDLALQDLVQHAAENGYDQLAWTGGDIQNRRYGLSNVVDHITVVPTDDAFSMPDDRTGNTRWHMRQEGSQLGSILVGPDGKIISNNDSFGDLAGKDMREVVGRELAEKGMAVPHETYFTGQDLELGGEGMRGFYDKMLPSAANKLFKRYGMQAQEGSLDRRIPYFDLRLRSVPGGVQYVDNADRPIGPVHPDIAAADDWQSAGNAVKKQKIWLLPITQAAKDAARKPPP